MAYVKLFSSILDSTVWETDPATRIVWITMLAMADRDGVVEASIPGLARRAGVSRAECEEALRLFGSPDPDSRTRDHEGRRILDADGGWQLVNYEKYRDKATAEESRRKAAERQRRFRERHTRGVTRNAGNVTCDAGDAGNAMSTHVTHSEAAADPEADPKPQPPIQDLIGLRPDGRPNERRRQRRQNPDREPDTEPDWQARAEQALRDPTGASFDPPRSWRPVRVIADTFAQALRLPKPKLGSVRDPTVANILELLAAGYSEAELVQAAERMRSDDWCREHVRTIAQITKRVVDEVSTEQGANSRLEQIQEWRTGNR